MGVEEKIQELIQSNDVVLFMKGNRHFPQCGFSSAVAKMLNELLPKYETVNVLADGEIREGIKAYSKWPTIPQLYIKGEFIGGSDIVRELYESGELHEKLGVQKKGAGADLSPAKLPQITVSESAKKALLDARDEPSLGLRIEIADDYATDLFLDEKQAKDIVIDVQGLPIFLDAGSAKRADGLKIDFVNGEKAGFRVENPNAPPRVKALRVKELKAMIDSGDAITIFDVRTPEEREIALLKEARHLDEKGAEYFEALPKDAKIAFLCHHGMRSRRAAERALELGFTQVFNIEGGIDAWSKDVDPSIPTY